MSNYGFCVSLGPEGNIYVSGSFVGPYRDPGPHDMGGFISCFDKMGALQWHREFYNPYGAIRIFNAVDSKGNVIIAGRGIRRYTSKGAFIDSLPSKGLKRAEGLCVNDNDDIIVAGFCYGDSSVGKIKVDGISFLAKYDRTGYQLWARPSYIDFGYNQDFDLTIDEVGNIYTCGGFRGKIEFSHDLNLTCQGQYDGFVCKYSPDGNPEWATRFGGDGISHEYPSALSVSNKGEVYITGLYDGVLVAGTYTSVLQRGVSDIFVLKLNNSGRAAWLKTGGGADLEHVRELTMDHQNNLFLTGFYDSPKSFQWTGIRVDNSEADEAGLFLLRLDSTGTAVNFQSSKSGTGEGRDLVCDNNGNLYLTGSFGGTLDFAGNAIDGDDEMFVIKLWYDMLDRVGIKELHDSHDTFEIFPNPATDSFSLMVTDGLCPYDTLNIYNVSGQRVFQQANAGECASKIKCTIAPGVYLVEIVSGTDRVTRKVVIQ